MHEARREFCQARRLDPRITTTRLPVSHRPNARCKQRPWLAGWRRMDGGGGESDKKDINSLDNDDASLNGSASSPV